jgi:hypothetical protein
VWLGLGIEFPGSLFDSKPIYNNVSDVANLKPMDIKASVQSVPSAPNLPEIKMRKDYLVDVAKYYKGEQHQIDALKWLQSQIPDTLLEKFVEEFSPLKLGEESLPPKESKYQLRFKFSPAKSSNLIYGILEFIRDGIVYNDIQATSSLPGRQYSGSWNQTGGLIPPTKMCMEKTGSGFSAKTTPIYMPNVQGVSGNFFPISPFEMETDGNTRGDWGIHRDANVPGSMGCIVPRTDKGWEAIQREFKILAGIGIRSVELIVEYT